MASSLNRHNWLFLLSLAGVVAGLTLVARLAHRREPSRPPPTPPAMTSPPSTDSVVGAPSTNPAPQDSGVRRLYGAFESARTAPDAATVRLHLAELRATLSSMPANEAVVAIRQFLDSTTDAPTHLGFKLAQNGLLDAAPTMRTFLLDEMARLDPLAGAQYATVILASKDSPDEWALALRNLARGDSSGAGRALLAQKAGEMLQFAPWRQEPSVGFLEAFDVAVYLGGTNLLPALTDMVRQPDNPATAHASFLALDRLVINDPATALTALLASPDLMEGREQSRANYFARGDVRDPQQRQLLEEYLLNPKTSPAELEAFAGLFPNANFMISPNLLTQAATPDRATLVSRDRESLNLAQQWLADPRFARAHPAMAKITLRLQEFVRQANAGR